VVKPCEPGALVAEIERLLATSDDEPDVEKAASVELGRQNR
jgi:hypothetical protein